MYGVMPLHSVSFTVDVQYLCQICHLVNGDMREHARYIFHSRGQLHQCCDAITVFWIK